MGNSVSTSENRKMAGWKPRGGGTSAPVKKLKYCRKGDLSIAVICSKSGNIIFNIQQPCTINSKQQACTFTAVEKINKEHECALLSNSGICAFF